jgi:predicted P-loop ATPase
MSNVKYQEVMNDKIKQNKVALQILQQKDADNVPKYWIGQYGSEQKLSMSDVIQAMEEYASARTKELEEENKREEEVSKQDDVSRLLAWLEYEFERIKEMKYFSDHFKEGYEGAIHDLKVIIKEGIPPIEGKP